MPNSNPCATPTPASHAASIVNGSLTIRRPETGTVTYQYDGNHRMIARIDAKGQQRQYTYDAYGRVTQVRHYLSATAELTTTLEEVLAGGTHEPRAWLHGPHRTRSLDRGIGGPSARSDH